MSDSRLPDGCMLNACYEIEKVLGRGGFGITYLARDTKLDLPVAVKEYLPEPFASRTDNHHVEPRESKVDLFDWGLSRFLSEAQILARFKHPNIVRVNAAFEQHGTAYMVMEYEEGVSLEDYLRDKDCDRSQEFFEKHILAIMGGLQGIHDKGFIHRDIKPANLMVRNDAEQSPVLIDFGSARSTGGAEAGKLTAVISAGYSPIEQQNSAAGEQGPWTDIYAFAASIREAITGEVPRASMDREFAARSSKARDPMQPLATTFTGRGYSHDFLNALDQGLSIMPEDRPQSLSEWRDIMQGKVSIKVPAEVPSSTGQDSVSTEVVQFPDGSQPGMGTVPESRVTGGDETVVVDSPTMVPAMPQTAQALPAIELSDPAVATAYPAGAMSESGAPTAAAGSSRMPLIAGGAAVVAIAGAVGFFMMSGDKSPEPVVVKDPVITTEPTATTDATKDTDTAPVVAAQLPKPPQPLMLISPVDRVKSEIDSLRIAANPFVDLLDRESIPQPVVQSIETIASKYTQLSGSEIVRAFPKLKSEVLAGLDLFSTSSDGAKQAFESLESTAPLEGSQIDGLLQNWQDLEANERSKLIFNLASLSADQRGELERQSEFSALVGQVNSSILSKIESKEFDSAARMVEVAMLLNQGDTELEKYKALLSGAN